MGWIRILLCYLAVAAAFTAAVAGASTLSDCRIEGIAETAQCGAFELPENASRPDGRRISIHVVVIPATGGRTGKDPIVPLGGGPGEEVISAAAAYAERLAPLRRGHDLLFVDQRGTGRSAPLDCELFDEREAADNLREFFPLAAVRRCREELTARADLTQYGYLRFADDLEHIRRVLGYGPLNLYAGSYGTRAAQVFLRAHPESVRTMYLGSVVPLDVEIPLPLARAAEEALEKTFSACEENAACEAAFPELEQKLRTVLERLESGSAKVSLPGHAEPVALDAGRVAEWIRARLYRPSAAAILPWAIHRAFEGDWQPIAEGILSGARGRDAEIGWGVFFAIACSGDIAFLREDDIDKATEGTFLGEYRVRQQQAACRDWPIEALPADYREPIASAVPTLFVSGDSDPATPLWFTARVAAGFSNAAEVVVRGHGHTEWNDCISNLYQELVRSGSVETLGESACPAVPRPPFRTP